MRMPESNPPIVIARLNALGYDAHELDAGTSP